MMKPTVIRLSVLAALVGASALPFAQSTLELNDLAKAAYDQKRFTESAELYERAYNRGRLTDALFNAACAYALGGKADKAFAALEKAAKMGYNSTKTLLAEKDFESLHALPQWARILAKVEENAKNDPPPAPWKKPYTIMDLFLAGRYEAKLGTESSAVWQDGEILTFAVRSKATSVRLNGGIQEPMKKVEGTDIWAIDLTMPGGWARVFASYNFLEVPPNPTALTVKTWAGPEAPALAVSLPSVSGSVITRKLHSRSLGEEREIHVYLPPNSPTKGLPAVFLADGGSCKEFARVLEPLILAGKVRPCAIVGIPAGRYSGKMEEPYDPMKDNRAREYVPGFDPDRFQQHMEFFTKEVGAYVQKEFGISGRREDRAVTGFSNGGAFSAAVAFRMPEFFGVSMPLSLGVRPTDQKPKSPLPRMYFAGGHLESFGVRSRELYLRVKSWGVETSFDEYMAGHDFEMWKLAFAKLMPRAFPPK